MSGVCRLGRVNMTAPSLMPSAARYFNPGPGTEARSLATSSTLRTTGNFRGWQWNCMYRVQRENDPPDHFLVCLTPSRPQVTLKKNRSEMMRMLKVVAETISFVICS